MMKIVKFLILMSLVSCMSCVTSVYVLLRYVQPDIGISNIVSHVALEKHDSISNKKSDVGLRSVINIRPESENNDINNIASPHRIDYERLHADINHMGQILVKFNEVLNRQIKNIHNKTSGNPDT